MFMEMSKKKAPKMCLWPEFRDINELKYHVHHSPREEKDTRIIKGSAFFS